MKIKILFCSIILFILLLVGCISQSSSLQTPIKTVKPSKTNSPKPATLIVSTIKPSLTLSHERKNATTMDPTFEEMRKTQEHYMFTQYPATMQARNVKCKEGFVLELEMDILQNSNDKWTLIYLFS